MENQLGGSNDLHPGLPKLDYTGILLAISFSRMNDEKTGVKL
jgi:hypothetical protein